MDGLANSKVLFINDVIISARYPRFSLQTTHVYNVPLIHGWSEVKPALNDDVIYDQPLIAFLLLTCLGNVKLVFYGVCCQRSDYSSAMKAWM